VIKFTVAGVLLDACVLGALSKAPAYGYELTQKTQTLLDISESALYPVLRRLEKDGLLTTYDQPFDGRNRRYYQITASGQEMLSAYKNDWSQYKSNIDTFLKGGRKDG
jgi:PadR family transcriptional regulator PadR